MKKSTLFLVPALALIFVVSTPAEEVSPAAAPLVGALQAILNFIQPAPDTAARAVDLDATFTSATGSLIFLAGRPLHLKFQAPNRFFLSTEVDGPVSLSSNGEKMWIHVPQKQLLLEGDAAVPRFSTRRDSTQATPVPAVRLPVTAAQLALIPTLAEISLTERADDFWQVDLTPREATAQSLHLPRATLSAIVADEKSLPESLSWNDHKGNTATLRITHHKISEGLPGDAWQPTPAAGVKT